jgi:hypothetical protein
VIRIDYRVGQEGPPGAETGSIPAASSSVTVKEVFLDRKLAEAEVERLNELNSEKSCRYFWQYTRLIATDERPVKD